MTVKESVEDMLRTEKSEIAPMNPRIEHVILGFGDEAGELLGAMKATKYYSRDFDYTNFKEELGDIWWYFRLALHELATMEGTTAEKMFDQIMEMNSAKLHARYPEGFSENEATNRDLAKERAAMEQTETDS